MLISIIQYIITNITNITHVVIQYHEELGKINYTNFIKY